MLGKKTASEPEAKGGAWAELIDAYQRSQEYRNLAATGRQNFDTMARKLIARWDYMIRADLEDRSIRNDLLVLRDEIAATGRLHSADKHLQAACRVLSFAYDRGLLAYDHGRKMKYTAPTGTRRGISFDVSQQAAALAALDPDFANAFRLALYTGLRAGDLCRLKWTDLDPQGWLYARPSKTRRTTDVELWFPTFALPPLAETLSAIPRRGPEILTYVSRSRAEPGVVKTWLRGQLKRRWMAVRESLGMSHLHWHDLRGTCIQALADSGCTEDEQAAISGHSLGSAKNHLVAYKVITRQHSERAYRKWAAAMDPASKIIPFRG
jgi:integrase